VVEDDDDARLLVTTVLRDRNCVVRAFADAETALEATTQDAPDVIVTDLRLRGAAGWTLASALREDPRTRHIVLIAVTGAVAPRREVVAPFDAYLRKPLDLDLLAQMVTQLAAVSRARAPKHQG
jgi:CheY-like chemotaxis protein